MLFLFLTWSVTPNAPRAPEILFKPELIGRDHCGIHESLFKSILGSDIDLRRSLLQNIVLSGNGSFLCAVVTAVHVYAGPTVMGGRVSPHSSLVHYSPTLSDLTVLKVETPYCLGSPSDSRRRSRACCPLTRGNASMSSAPWTETSLCGVAARCLLTCSLSTRRG